MSRNTDQGSAFRKEIQPRKTVITVERICLIEGLSANLTHTLQVIAKFEIPKKGTYYDLGYEFMGKLVGRDARTVGRNTQALVKLGLVSKTTRKKKGIHVEDILKVNWAAVIEQSQPTVDKITAEFERRRTIVRKRPMVPDENVLYYNKLTTISTKTKKVISASAKANAEPGDKTLPERTGGKRLTLQKTSRLSGENLKAMVQSLKHDVYKVWFDSGGKVEGLDDWVPILEDGTGRTKKDLENFTKGVLTAYEYDLPVYDPEEVMRYALALKDFWGKPNPFKKDKPLYPESWYMVKTVHRFVTAMEESKCR